MTKRILLSGTAIGLSALLTACASTPPQNDMVDEAKANYEAIADDPYVARSGAVQLRDAEQSLNKAERLLADEKSTEMVEHSAYLANQHALIATQQGKRAQLQEEIKKAEDRREQLNLQSAKSEADRLRAQMEALQAEKTDRGMVLTLGDVLFDLNKAELKPSGERTVQRLADFMNEYTDRRVRVEGYTDSTGAEAYNQKLSERRAEAVRNALILDGIDSSRVDVQGFGEAYPVASNDTNSGRQQNRRVEIVISDEKGDIKTR